MIAAQIFNEFASFDTASKSEKLNLADFLQRLTCFNDVSAENGGPVFSFVPLVERSVSGVMGTKYVFLIKEAADIADYENGKANIRGAGVRAAVKLTMPSIANIDIVGISREPDVTWLNKKGEAQETPEILFGSQVEANKVKLLVQEDICEDHAGLRLITDTLLLFASDHPYVAQFKTSEKDKATLSLFRQPG